MPKQDGKPYLQAQGGTENVVRWSSGQNWQFIDQGNGYYQIKLPNDQMPKQDGKPYLHAQGGTENVVRWSFGQNWQLIKQQRSNNKIETAQSVYNTANESYQLGNTELERLQAVLNANLSQQQAWQTRLTEVNNQLTQVQTELNTANNTVISTLNQVNAQPQTMPQVARDAKGLITKGAVLGFVQPASRLNAIETCEGNVQLSYFDTQGRMQQTNYDATADANNTAFEQWIPNSLRACLNLTNNNSQIQLTSPLYLSDEWTVETWFSYPLPRKQVAGPTLENILDNLNQNYQSITSLVPNRYEFSEGESGSGINDGGNDMYDAGNFLGTNLGVSIPYSNNVITTSELLGNSRYFTRKYPGLFVFVAETHGITEFKITGNLGADNAGSCNGTVLTATKDGVTYKGFVKRVYGAGDPSVNHLIIIQDNGSATHTYASNTDDDSHTISNLTGVTKLYYLLYAAQSGGLISDAQTQELMNKFLEMIPNPNNTSNNTLVNTINNERLVVQASNKLGIIVGNVFYDSGYNLSLLSPGWHHLAAVAKKGTTVFYVDGRQVADVKQALIDAAPDDASKKQLAGKICKIGGSFSIIGNSSIGSEQFGKLSEFRIWQVALSDDEVAANSKTLLSGNEPGLLAYYPLNEATGTTVRDKTGSGNNGTVVGTWWGCNAPIGMNVSLRKDGVVNFNGTSNSYVSLPAAVASNISNQITVEAWVYSNPLLQASDYRGIITNVFTNTGSLTFELCLCTSDHKLFAGFYKDSSWYSQQADSSFPINQWVHVAACYDGRRIKIYQNGSLIKQSTQDLNVSLPLNTNQWWIGRRHDLGNPSDMWNGKISDVRIWKVARTQAEIQANMSSRLTGTETNLVAYYRLDEITTEGTTKKVLDRTANNYHGTVTEAVVTNDSMLPVVGATPVKDALVSAEYSTITLTPNGKVAIMRRFFAYPDRNAAILLPDKRVEQLELKWIGNAQFAPTLLGYMEGAPPVPTENLTLSDDYNAASSVELNMSEDVAFSWNRSQDSGLGAAVDIFMGGDTEMNAGLGITTKLAAMRAGFKGNLDFSYQFQNQSNITSSSSLSMTDKLELRGTPETTPKFPHLGNRFIPKNVGYALVVSALADVFITRLARSGKMVGYQVQPVDGIPPDVNTITFLMNPAYTMSGSLDGLTGSSATSERFFKHVPQMRAQYGSLYPASYYRLQEAYNLKKAIEKEDKRRESYFDNFDVRTIDETSLARNIDSGDAPTTIGVEREEDKASTTMTEEEKKKAEEQKAAQIKAESAGLVKQQSAATEAKKAEIQSKIDDQDQRVQAQTSFASWQKRMEDIQIKAGKRNIVNTYVWDADGGLRTEAQSFANTVEHTIGGSFILNAGLGFEGKFAAFAAVELTAQATVNMTQTMSKTESRSKGIELNVDLSGVEFRGITNYKDLPILPGEKVDRYRFMSFYLEGTTQNFQDFFSYVVDPEWLASNDEEARALRQTKAGKPNKTWRVLHRVTYVERPALMGFGRDLRQVGDTDQATQEILDYFTQLEVRHQELKTENLNLKNQIIAVQKQLVDSTQELQSKLDQILLKINPH
ncbi:LamG-like jellyroll fold domain-containing protein [Microseira wollei]|uniref:LamG-like jellyroll fold domain-containing protein n=1 Tax=Microseira wollei NIES-4236 TaxID=2530354 RepID=A0AAV3XSI7_9CYAN|nr:LamG-like jellyroll fold domain-containing protein [Microseira wollei]GET43657.1 hypothetical protein MiSe_84820 [Microseira wollei NIES-4236]